MRPYPRRIALVHPAWTYMLRDIGGSLAGILLFAFALLSPGYLAAYGSDVCGFRSRSLPEQAAWSIVLSFGVGTLSTVAITWLFGMTAAAYLLAAAGACSMWVAVQSGRFLSQQWRRSVPFFALGLLFSGIAVTSLIDIGVHDQLHMSVTAYDNAVRTAFVDAVLRTGVPPANPVYWPGHDAPMRYYYFWYVVCAAVAKLGHISARQALIASSAWSMFGVAAVLALFCRYVLGWRGTALTRRWWTAVALMGVTGFDGLIALLIYLSSGIVARDIEWWSLAQVSSWADTFLWVPHHAAALVCAVTCIVLVRLAIRNSTDQPVVLLAIFAGISFASAFGLSTYVAIGCAFVLSTWFVALVVQRKRLPALKPYAVMIATAGLLLTPYLLQLLRPQPGARVNAGGILAFGVRELLPPIVLSGAPGVRTLAVTHPYMANELSAALLLLPSYFLELGFFAVALLTLQRRKEKTSGERLLLLLAWASLVSVSVLRSRVITMNDYSVRASLIAQFCLLPAGVLALERSRQLTRFFLVVLLCIGAAGSIYQIVLLRTFLPVHDREGVKSYAGLAHRNYVLRDGYLAMQVKIPPQARVQFSYPNESYTALAHQMNIGRQMIVDSEHCNDSFGGENAPCISIQSSLLQIFNGERALSTTEVVQRCASVGAEYLSIASWDPAWKRRDEWVWSLPAVVVRPEMRVVSCSEKAATD